MAVPRTFETKIDNCIASMSADHKAAVKAAAIALRDEIAAEQAAYGSCAQERVWLEDRILYLLNDLAMWMHR